MTNRYKINHLLNEHETLKKQFNSLIANPEHKLAKIPNVTVLPHSSDYLIIEALDSEIHIKFQIVTSEENCTLGQVTSYLIKDGDTVPIRSTWFDKLGNIKYPEPDELSLSHIDYDESLSDFVYETIGGLLDLSDFKPLVNSKK